MPVGEGMTLHPLTLATPFGDSARWRSAPRIATVSPTENSSRVTAPEGHMGRESY